MQNAFSFNLERNSSGNVTKITGVGGQLLDWLSVYHNFRLFCLKIIYADILGFILFLYSLLYIKKKQILLYYSYSPLQIDRDVDFDDMRKGLVGFILRGVIYMISFSHQSYTIHRKKEAYNWLQECDVAGAILTTLSRSELVDFSHPVVYNPGYFLIPASTVIPFNISSAVLPFQPSVCNIVQ